MTSAKIRIADIESKMQISDFWNDHLKAGELAKELADLQEEIRFWEQVENRLAGYLDLEDSGLENKKAEIVNFKKSFDSAYIKVFLSGKYDRGNALLYVYSGAGGVDAQDWAGMLFRMYQRYSQRIGYDWTVIDQSLGEQGGLKHAVVEIRGRYVYGALRGESGVHRLVRISPFSAKSLRHTSFALVDVLPEIEDVSASAIDINPNDIEMEAFRSSGPGGQNVNKVSTAVRIKHIPTGIAVAVQSERSQAQNREKAIQILKSKLIKMMEDSKVQELSQLKVSNEPGSIEWGSQIRSYVLNPYKLVKDHRTNIESSQPEKILEGELDEFIEKEITQLSERSRA